MAHDHAHAHAEDADARRLGIAFALIVVFMLGEVAAGIVASSLALLSDAGHMLTDAVALGRSRPCDSRSGRRPAASPTG
jgi:cobalt-zinc-cadmium efflux system protein